CTQHSALSTQHLLGLDALLPGDGLLLALAGAGVGSGALAADREAAPVALAAVGADLLEALDILGDLAAQGALDDVPAVDDGVDRRELLLVQLAGAQVGVDRCLREDVMGELRPDPVDVLEGEED